jgi:hypothetical protein
VYKGFKTKSFGLCLFGTKAKAKGFAEQSFDAKGVLSSSFPSLIFPNPFGLCAEGRLPSAQRPKGLGKISEGKEEGKVRKNMEGSSYS